MCGFGVAILSSLLVTMSSQAGNTSTAIEESIALKTNTNNIATADESIVAVKPTDESKPEVETTLNAIETTEVVPDVTEESATECTEAVTEGVSEEVYTEDYEEDYEEGLEEVSEEDNEEDYEEDAEEAPDYSWEGSVLTPSSGVNYGPSGMETYYNLPMEGVVNIMRDAGFSEEDYPYHISDNGCKMLGDYIMVAADFNIRPRGTVIETSLGMGLVCDTGSFTYSCSEGLDIAVSW